MEADDRIILVTGATDGLGRAIAERLAGHGCTVLLHGRSRAKAEQTLAEISKTTGNDRLECYIADFADLHQVMAMAERIRTDHPRLDTLVNNAHIGPLTNGTDEPQKSHNGHELRFAVNYLAQFALTYALYPALNQTAKRNDARIVNVIDGNQGPIAFDDIMLTNDYSGRRAHAQSASARVSMTLDLATRFADTGVAATCVNPTTPPVVAGVDAAVALIETNDLPGINGKCFEMTRPVKPHARATNKTNRERLHDLGEKLCGL